MVVTNLIYQLGLLLNKAKLDVINLRMAIELTANQKLSLTLAPIKILMEILTEIQTKLPPAMQMLAPITTQYINLYYSQAKVISYTDSEKIYTTAQIPLIVYSEVFEVYNVFNIPQYNEDLHIVVNI